MVRGKTRNSRDNELFMISHEKHGRQGSMRELRLVRPHSLLVRHRRSEIQNGKNPWGSKEEIPE